MDQGIAPGMTLQKALLHPVTGKVLLPAGTVLTAGYIERIERQGLDDFLLECLDIYVPPAQSGEKSSRDLDEFEIDIPDVTDMLAEITRQIGLAAPAGVKASPSSAPAPQPIYVAASQEGQAAGYIPSAAQPNWVPTGAGAAAQGGGHLAAAAPPAPGGVLPVAGNTSVMRYYHNPGHFMPERSLMAAMALVDDLDNAVKLGGAPSYPHLARVVNEVIDRLGNNIQGLNTGIEVRVVNQTHARSHPVNVFILSVVTGLALSYSQEQLLQLGIAALCHDIGKSAIPQELLNKVGTLNPQEVELLRAHTLIGKRIMEKFPWADPLLSRIIYEHHERTDGSGYPQKLVDRQIHEMSKIVAVAEVYDALMSDTGYRARYTPEIAYNSIKVGDRSGLDAKVIRAFQRYIWPYPLHSWVSLDSGDVAQVVQQNKQNPLKPVIKLNNNTIELGDQAQYAITNSHFRAF